MAGDSLYKQLESVFNEVRDSCMKDAKEKTKKHAQKLKNKIRKDSPEKTGDYKKGWTVEKTMETEFNYSVVVRNKKEPTLPHLLENGHVIKVRKGHKGRYYIEETGKKVSGKAHILSNAEQEIEEL